MKRTKTTCFAALAFAMAMGVGTALADDVEALQPIKTWDLSEADARNAAKLLAQQQCDHNTRLIRAVRVLPGECRYEESEGQWMCYGQKFVCAEQH